MPVFVWFKELHGNFIAGLRFLFGSPVQRDAAQDVGDILAFVARLRSAERTDERYDEPIACYPVMEVM